jgi:hypothetical protein
MSETAPQTTAAPSPRVRVEGTLETIRASDASFVLKQDDGRELSCRLVGRAIEELAQLLGRRVLVFGTAVRSGGGDALRLDVDGYLPNDGKLFVSSLPSVQWTAEEKEEMARRLRNVMGQWPGDETDAEIERALRELS